MTADLFLLLATCLRLKSVEALPHLSALADLEGLLRLSFSRHPRSRKLPRLTARIPLEMLSPDI